MIRVPVADSGDSGDSGERQESPESEWNSFAPYALITIRLALQIRRISDLS